MSRTCKFCQVVYEDDMNACPNCGTPAGGDGSENSIKNIQKNGAAHTYTNLASDFIDAAVVEVDRSAEHIDSLISSYERRHGDEPKIMRPEGASKKPAPVKTYRTSRWISFSWFAFFTFIAFWGDAWVAPGLIWLVSSVIVFPSMDHLWQLLEERRNISVSPKLRLAIGWILLVFGLFILGNMDV